LLADGDCNAALAKRKLATASRALLGISKAKYRTLRDLCIEMFKLQKHDPCFAWAQILCGSASPNTVSPDAGPVMQLRFNTRSYADGKRGA
jgi:hypothetical protein